MAKEKPVYEVVDEFGELVNKLISLNEDKFGDIDPKMIRMTKITNKEAPSGQPFKIIRINNPVALFCPFRYVIVTWEQVWDSFSEDQKGLMLLDVLHYLEPDEEEPKLISPDVKDHSDMLRTFGVDYLNNPEIKGVFKKPIDWAEGYSGEEDKEDDVDEVEKLEDDAEDGDKGEDKNAGDGEDKLE